MELFRKIYLIRFENEFEKFLLKLKQTETKRVPPNRKKR